MAELLRLLGPSRVVVVRLGHRVLVHHGLTDRLPVHRQYPALPVIVREAPRAPVRVCVDLPCLSFPLPEGPTVLHLVVVSVFPPAHRLQVPSLQRVLLHVPAHVHL